MFQVIFIFTNLLVLTRGWDIFEKKGASEKGCVEIEDGFSVHFVLGFQEKSIYTLHLRFRQDITKWCKVYTKADSWFQKSHEPFGQLQTSSGKSKNLKFDGLLSKKYIASTKILYTKDLSNITFNYLCEKSQNYLSRFWNHKSFFTTQLLCIFLAQTLHTSYKSSPSKCKFSDFSLLVFKFTKFLMSFFKQKLSFFSRFGSFFIVMRDTVYFFSWNFRCYWQR